MIEHDCITKLKAKMAHKSYIQNCTAWTKYGITNNAKVKVGVLRPVQQPGSYWDRSSELPLVGLEPTEVTAYD